MTAMKRDHVDRFLERLDGIPDLDYEVEGIVERLTGLHRSFHRTLEETLGEHGLMLGEWKVLRQLKFKGEESCSPGDLSADLDLSSGAMTNRLDKLERRGLIERRRDPDDRRGVLLELTEAGDRAWTDSTNAQARKEALLAGALTKAEQKQLNGLLRKLVLEFDEESAG
jgi:DNA-binding MarR family transcriptional regulator